MRTGDEIWGGGHNERFGSWLSFSKKICAQEKKQLHSSLCCEVSKLELPRGSESVKGPREGGQTREKLLKQNSIFYSKEE